MIRSERATTQALIEIEDRGAGIESEILKNVTDPFFTTRLGSGATGPGLSVLCQVRLLRSSAGAAPMVGGISSKAPPKAAGGTRGWRSHNPAALAIGDLASPSCLTPVPWH